MQDLQGLRDRIDKQMQIANQNQQPTPQINQNFQITPTQNNNGIKYVNSLDEVKQELIFADTIFVNKEFNTMWLKNTSGDIKIYSLKEVIQKDEKDLKIEELEAKINKLIKEKENEQYANENANGATSNKKSTDGNSNKSSNE